ncbi:hypothetical protein HZS_2571, partial [Henneguya salminicola]
MSEKFISISEILNATYQMETGHYLVGYFENFNKIPNTLNNFNLKLTDHTGNIFCEILSGINNFDISNNIYKIKKFQLISLKPSLFINNEKIEIFAEISEIELYTTFRPFQSIRRTKKISLIGFIKEISTKFGGNFFVKIVEKDFLNLVIIRKNLTFLRRVIGTNRFGVFRHLELVTEIKRTRVYLSSRLTTFIALTTFNEPYMVDCINQVNYKGTVTSTFFSLGMILLDRSVKVFIKLSHDLINILSVRVGTVLVCNNFHLIKHPDEFSLVSCMFSSIEIKKFSLLPALPIIDVCFNDIIKIHENNICPLLTFKLYKMLLTSHNKHTSLKFLKWAIKFIGKSINKTEPINIFLKTHACDFQPHHNYLYTVPDVLSLIKNSLNSTHIRSSLIWESNTEFMARFPFLNAQIIQSHRYFSIFTRISTKDIEFNPILMGFLTFDSDSCDLLLSYPGIGSIPLIISEKSKCIDLLQFCIRFRHPVFITKYTIIIEQTHSRLCYDSEFKYFICFNPSNMIPININPMIQSKQGLKIYISSKSLIQSTKGTKDIKYFTLNIRFIDPNKPANDDKNTKYYTLKCNNNMKKSNQELSLVFCIKDLNTFDFINIYISSESLIPTKFYPMYMILTFNNLERRTSKCGRVYFYATNKTSIYECRFSLKNISIHALLLAKLNNSDFVLLEFEEKFDFKHDSHIPTILGINYKNWRILMSQMIEVGVATINITSSFEASISDEFGIINNGISFDKNIFKFCTNYHKKVFIYASLPNNDYVYTKALQNIPKFKVLHVDL